MRLGRNQVAVVLDDVLVALRRVATFADAACGQDCGCCTMMHRVIGRMEAGIRRASPRRHPFGFDQLNYLLFEFVLSLDLALNVR
jgi:hypothetical protein